MKVRIPVLFLVLQFLKMPVFSQAPGDSLFQATIVHTINITFTQPNFWDSLMRYKQYADSFNLSTQSMMGDVYIDGVLIDSAGIKLKGNSSFGYPGRKKPVKIEFNEYVKGKKYNGLKTINLNNNTLDPTHMREKLVLDFMNSRGISAPRCTYARLNYNGQYVGLYKLVEEIDKTFLDTHYGNNGGNLFKGDPQGSLFWLGNSAAAYYGMYELKTNTTANNWSDLVNFIDNVNNTPAANFKDTLDSNLNTALFIKYWAAENLFVDLDSYFHSPHNYYLYHNTLTKKMEWVAWDVSVAFGFYPYMKEVQTTSVSVLETAFPLTNNILANTSYKTDYLNAICLYLDYFSNSVLNPKIDSIANIIRPHIYAEPDSNQMFPEPAFEMGMDTLTIVTAVGDIPGLKRFITNRRNNVLGQLAGLSFICANAIQENGNGTASAVLYPNPFSGTATLRMRGELQNAELKLYNSLGQIVKIMSGLNSGEIKISREGLRDGIYFYEVSDKNKIAARGKFVVE